MTSVIGFARSVPTSVKWRSWRHLSQALLAIFLIASSLSPHAIALPGPAAEPASPHIVRDINPDSASGYLDQPSELTVVGGLLYLASRFYPNGVELLKSDGTDGATVLVDDINPGPANSNPSQLTNVSGQLFFIADDGTHGAELWKSDGTAAGTVLVKDIKPGGCRHEGHVADSRRPPALLHGRRWHPRTRTLEE